MYGKLRWSGKKRTRETQLDSTSALIRLSSTKTKKHTNKLNNAENQQMQIITSTNNASCAIQDFIDVASRAK